MWYYFFAGMGIGILCGLYVGLTVKDMPEEEHTNCDEQFFRMRNIYIKQIAERDNEIDRLIRCQS